MASESGDSSDGPSLTWDSNDELLENLQFQPDPLDLPMPDIQAVHGLSSLAPEYTAAEIDQQGVDSQGLTQSLLGNMMELCDAGNQNDKNAGGVDTNRATNVASEQQNGGVISTESDRLRSLLNNSTEDSEALAALLEGTNPLEGADRPSKDKEVVIKKEAPDCEEMMSRFIPAEVIDISDTDDDTSKIYSNEKYRYGNTLADGTIEISDGEVEVEEIIVYDDGSTSVGIKKENPDVEFLGAKKNPVEAPEDSSSEDEPQIRPLPNLGRSLLKTPNQRGECTPADLDKAKRMQKLYAVRALANRVKTGASNVFMAPQPAVPSATGVASSDDTFSWMSDTTLPDQPATDFQAFKQKYKAKRKSRKNTLEDDVGFKKAQIDENNRLRRLALETADSEPSEDEAEESDDGIFVSEGPPKSTERPLFAEPMDEDGDDDDELVLTKMLTGKSAPKKSKANGPGNQAELSTKRSRAKDRERELRSNMMAGIEAILLRDQKRREEAAAKTAEGEGGKRPNKRQKFKPVDNSAKRTKTGRMNNIGSLMNSNIYEDSNANLNKPALPHVADKKKKEFMTSLVANIPLADQKQANSDRVDIMRATKILGSYKVVPDRKGNWAFKGMRSSLYHYQVQGAAYMKTREIGDQNPYGGILADEMGLGKTVQMITTMVAHPQIDPNLPKCTLIVCSPALIGQWEKELEVHVKEGIFKRIVRHHGKYHFSGKGAEEDMENANIVLTTYGEVVRSYPICDLPEELKTPAEKEAWWIQYWDEQRNLLHRAQFYRVVLDEAQVIKNHSSQTSIACRALMAKHRWAISGTPIQNRLDELFPYFKFLRVKHTGSIGVFRQNFCLKDSDVCNKRLHSMLDGMMVRRTHQDTVLGAPLIKLPENTQETIRLKFNKVERSIYDRVHMRCVNLINAVAKDGTLEEQTRAVIIMFQRLRQMVSHIFMVQEVIQDLKHFSVHSMWQSIIAEDPEYTSTEEGMMLGLEKMIAEKEDRPEDVHGDGLLFINPKQKEGAAKSKKTAGTLIVRFGKFLKDLKKNSKWAELRERSLCHTCGQPPDNPHVTSCMHVFCEECLNNLAYEAAKRDLDHTPCGNCGTVYTESVSCKDLKELQVRDLSASVFQDGKEKAPTKKPFKLTMRYVDSKDGLLLSTKCAAVKAQLTKWIAEDPNCKIIVFTEWLMVMHVLGRVCQGEGWKCCHVGQVFKQDSFRAQAKVGQYNGKMSHNARDEALSAFRDDKPKSDVQILIASLKCGGTGLNLTVASKVICVDLWFNKCVEQQAFARVFRIGQAQETYITRYVVEDTVDERLIAMQEEKSEIISGAMDDRSVMAQLTLPELLRLFGPVAYDENSKPFIMVDDYDEKRRNSSL